MLLNGEPLVGRILERVKRCSLIDEIVLAIPDDSSNNCLADLANKYNVKLFRGSENDVLSRYYFAAKESQASIVGRLPADNPVPEPSEIDRIITHHKLRMDYGFSSNLSPFWSSGYPDGIGAEMFDFELLEHAYKHHHKPCQREHVHLNFFDYTTQCGYDTNWCKVSTIKCPESFSRPDLILDVNNIDQYQYFSSMYNDLYPENPQFGILDIIKWHDSRKRA